MSGSNQRRHTRVPASSVAIRVKFHDVADLQQYYLRDISKGGIFLRAKNLRPLQSQLVIAFTMPDGEEVTLRGEVVHVVPPEQATPTRPSGMGIQFLDLTPEVMRQIEAYVERLQKRSTVVPATELPKAASGPVGLAKPAAAKPAVAAPAAAATKGAGVPAALASSAGSGATGGLALGQGDQELLRRVCWLLAEGGLLGRPLEELFGTSEDMPIVARREIYERLRAALAPERPPTYLGEEEARAVVRMLALLESLTREE